MSLISNSWAAALFAGLLLSSGAQSQPTQMQTPTSISASRSHIGDNAPVAAAVGKLQFGQPGAVPMGYYQMCVKHPNFCRVHGGRVATTRDGSVKLTSAMRDQLNAVNARVNATILPAYRDDWTPERSVGDCKDFAMTKRQRLINSGWPTAALPVAIVRTSFGEQHLVLVARTTEGDLVLDNLTDGIVPWRWTSYSWEKIQSTTDAFAWRNL